MNSFTPCFPPVILEKCLDFAKYLTEKKTGKASLEINLGTSRFAFSMDQTSQIQTGSSSQDHPKKLRKKKSPSVRKRDSLRMEKHLENKRKATPPANSSSSNNSTTPAELNQEVLIEEFPLISNNAKDMDTVEEIVPENKPRDKLIAQETVNEPVLETRNSVNKVPEYLQTKDIAEPVSETSDTNFEMIDAALT